MDRRLTGYVIGAAAGLGVLWLLAPTRPSPRDDARAREERYEEGEAATVPSAAPPSPAPSPAPAPVLAEARRGFRTAIAVPNAAPTPLPEPPADLYVRVDSPGPDGRALPAFVTPDPKDGRRHPAILWLTGGDSSTLDDFWTPGPDANDQSVRAFREAGVVTAFPTLRGGNTDGGAKEYFLGEVDDVLAAADRVAALPYVDPANVYLGGHSTGGTLALLTAETSGRFRAVFAFGPVSDVERYPASLVPVRFAEHDPLEAKLRSPIHWRHGLTSPTYVIEGADPPGNADELERLCEGDGRDRLVCIRVPGADHFSVLSRVTRVIAARVAVSGGGAAATLRPEDFADGENGAEGADAR